MNELLKYLGLLWNIRILEDLNPIGKFPIHLFGTNDWYEIP
jgi:hypothetical protein